MNYRKIIVLTIFCSVCVFPSFTQSIDSEKERLDVLEFGIESDVQGVLKSLTIEKETKYNDKIFQLLVKAKSKSLKENIFKYFTDTKNNIAEDLAISELTLAQDNPASTTVMPCLYYLGEINSTKAETALLGLIESTNKNLAILSIRTLGKLKAKSVGPTILKKLNDSNFDEKLKGDLIWTLGELAYIEATKDLVSLLEDYADKPANKQLVIEAMGKFKTPEAFATIINFVDDDNAIVRARVINTLSNFPSTPEIIQLILSALRDNQVSVRLAALEAATLKKDPAFLPSIQFRLKKDPEIQIRIKALRSILDWDQNLASTSIKDILLDKTVDLKLWNECLYLSIEKDIPGLQSVLNEIISRDIKDKFSPYPDMITKAITAKTKINFEELYKQLLTQDKNKKIQAINGISANKLKTLEPNLRALIADTKEDDQVKIKAKDALKALGLTP